MFSGVPMPALLLFLLPQSPCEMARTKGAEFQKDADAWAARHRADCPLCAPGSRCREGDEWADEVQSRADGSLKRLKERGAHCLKGAACERAALLGNDAQRERLAAWKRHVLECSCTRRTMRP